MTKTTGDSGSYFEDSRGGRSSPLIVKKILVIAIALISFLLSGSMLYAEDAEDGAPKLFAGLDAGKDSWGFEAGLRFKQTYAAMGGSARDIGDEWSQQHNRFDYAPLTTWKLTDRYNTNEGEFYLKYGVFLTSYLGIEAGVGHARQDIVETYNDPNTGLTWERVVRGDRGFYTAMAGARYVVSKRFYFYINYHTSRGAILGIGIF